MPAQLAWGQQMVGAEAPFSFDPHWWPERSSLIFCRARNRFRELECLAMITE